MNTGIFQSKQTNNDKQIIFSWSGGKDSAYALYKLLKEDKYSIKCLFTTLSEEYQRVNFHAIPPNLLDAQAEAIGLKLDKVFITQSNNINEYADKLEPYLLTHLDKGIKTIAYGDIYLEDLRDFRINCLKKIDMKSIYPIWKTNSTQNIIDFINLGFKAILTCVDANVLDKSFVGRDIDPQFIRDLPKNVDPCGENGEFHTFVYDGPIFKEKINFTKGEIVNINSFYYCDII